MTSVEQIPMLRQPGPDTGRPGRPLWSRLSGEGSARRRVPGPALPRRRFLQAATAVGFAALGVFSAARQAYADGYDIWTGACPTYAADHNCSPGCGPSTIYADACVTSGTLAGFHKNDGQLWTLRPNQCYSGSYDGWLWRYSGACGTCGCGIERRCHDGYRNTSSGWVRSICRWTTDCGCSGSVSWPTTSRGSSGPNVYTVQYLLTYRGFATTADGIFGPNTETRVKEFQQSRGLSTTGSVGSATWPVLVATVRRGDSNNAVRGAQHQLNKHGYALTVDGIFGARTEEAVLSFQSKMGLTADGIVGTATWRTLTGTA